MCDNAKPDSGCTLSDTDRLVWLRRNVSGREMRRIGICMDNTGDTEEFRKRIDKIIIVNAGLTLAGKEPRKHEND